MMIKYSNRILPCLNCYALSVVPLYCRWAYQPLRPLYIVSHGISEVLYMKQLHVHSLELLLALPVSVAKNNEWKSLPKSQQHLCYQVKNQSGLIFQPLARAVWELPGKLISSPSSRGRACRLRVTCGLHVAWNLIPCVI